MTKTPGNCGWINGSYTHPSVAALWSEGASYLAALSPAGPASVCYSHCVIIVVAQLLSHV